MIDTELEGVREGDTVFATQSTLRAIVTGGDSTTLRVIKNGEVLEEVAVSGDPLIHEIETEAPLTGTDRYRHEIVNRSRLVTVTSYVWLQRADPEANDGCSVTPASDSHALAWLPLVGLAGIACARRWRARHRRSSPGSNRRQTYSAATWP